MAKARFFKLSAVLSALFVGPAGHAQDWAGTLDIASDYVVRGVSRSHGDPSAQVDLQRSMGAGWSAGLSVASVRLGRNEPISAEVAPRLAYGFRISEDWRTQVSATHYEYLGSNSADQYRYDELEGGLGWRDRVQLALSFLPDQSIESRYGAANGRLALTADLVVHTPLLAGWSMNEGVGYYDLNDLIGAGYLYWNAGLAYDLGRVQVDVSYIGTNATAKSLYYGRTAADRWTAALVWRFL
jgi:uncharacterized protein (TIGR02001 family)